MNLLQVITFLILGLIVAESAPIYPFNVTSDFKVTPCDDCCSPVHTLQGIFRFFGVNYDQFSITSNGLIQFGNGCDYGYTPLPFPSTIYPSLAVYWADADLRSRI